MTITPILIRAAARGGKFLGVDAGGANVWVFNATTGESYASERNVNGDSGPAAMMTNPSLRDSPIPVDSGTAGLFLTPDLDAPSLLFIAVEGPVRYPDQASIVTSQAWVLDGVGTGDPTKGDTGLVIEVPGICVALQSHSYVDATRTLTVSAAVMMMCGCKVGATFGSVSPWPPADFDVQLVVGFGGGGTQSYTISYSGTPSIYTIAKQLPSKPAWAMITASQHSMGQSGVCTVLGDPPLVKRARILPSWIAPR